MRPFQNHVITVDLDVDLHGTYRQTSYILDNSTSALHNWVSMGAPKYPTQAEIAQLKRMSRPRETCALVNNFHFHQHLVPQEVRMFILEKVK